MAHADTQILAAVTGRLVSMTTVDDDNVFQEHVWDFTDDELPAIDCTIVASEVLSDEDETTFGSQIAIRSLITVTHYAKTGAGVGDQLREQASEVISKLIPSAADVDLGGTVSEIDYVGYDLELSSEEEKPIGRLTQTFAAVYRVLVYDLETIQS